MTENSLRSILGILLVFLHLGILGLVFITYSKGGFRFDEFTSPVGVIVPMFTGYTTVIMVYFSKNRFRVNDTSPKVTALFVFWSTVFPVLLFLALTI
ncbi:MAG: hypothetical protein KJ645_14835, partial [Planctomycetes bacterium]|nr:hypothetical protein [Planctomycetota bacterium]